MGSKNHLYRRPSGIYVVRISVPQRHRPRIGRGEIHVSTAVRDLAQANVAALDVALQWKRRFAALDRMDILKIVDGSPLLAGDGHLRFTDAAKALGVDPRELLQEVSNRGSRLFCLAMQWIGYVLPDLDQVDRESNGGLIVNSALHLGERESISGLLTIVDSDFHAQELARTGKCSLAHALIDPDGRHVFFDAPLRQLGIGDVLLSKKDTEEIRLTFLSRVKPEAIAHARSRQASMPSAAGET